MSTLQINNDQVVPSGIWDIKIDPYPGRSVPDVDNRTPSPEPRPPAPRAIRNVSSVAVVSAGQSNS